MTKENHDRLQGLSTDAKDAYIAAKTQILEAISKMDLLANTSLTDEEKTTIYELLDDTAFLMKSK